jgi:hypothetical protein
MNALNDMLDRWTSVGDRHDRRMAEIASEELEQLHKKLARLQAVEAAARELLDTAGGSGELTGLVIKRGARNQLAAALDCPSA